MHISLVLILYKSVTPWLAAIPVIDDANLLMKHTQKKASQFTMDKEAQGVKTVPKVKT